MESALSLANALQSASWHQLFAIARAHGLRVSNRWAKDDLVATLHTHLGHPNTFPAIITLLPPSVHDALRTLVHAQGRLPLIAFTRQFGQFHPYRPWRKEAKQSPKPWEKPTSPADHLWFLGLFFAAPSRSRAGQITYATLPQEILNQIAPLFDLTSGSPAVYPLSRPGQPADFLWHLAIFLAFAAPSSPKLRNGRWLLPSDLAALAARTGLDQNPTFKPSRSERHLSYLAFLHYLAECNQFLTHGPTLGLTPLAWQWLARESQERWQQIWQEFVRSAPDMASPYRFPWASLTPQGWSLLTASLGRLSVQEYRPLPDFIADLRTRDPYALLGHKEDDDPLARLLCGPLHWMGIIDLGEEALASPSANMAANVPAHPPVSPIESETDAPDPWFDMDRDLAEPTQPDPANRYFVRLTQLGAWLAQVDGWGPPAFPAPQPAHLFNQEPDTLRLGVETSPLHLARLAAYTDWQPPDFPDTAQRFTLVAPKVGMTVASGTPLTQIIQDLSQALGRSPSRRQRQLLRSWAKAAQQVQVRQVTLLETSSATLMGELRSRRHLRRFLGTPLSPTRSEINPNDLAALAKSLSGQGLYISPQPSSKPDDTQEKEGKPYESGSSNDTSQSPLLLTAALVLNGLAAHAQLPLRLPIDLLQELDDALSVNQKESAHLHARAVLDQIESAISGYLRLPAWRLETADHQVYPQIKKALEAGEDVTIVYWNADSGQPIQRRITPYYIETRHRVRYLHAWCHLRQDERIFRLDRIERILGGDPDQSAGSASSISS